jgi:hypothetical protein
MPYTISLAAEQISNTNWTENSLELQNYDSSLELNILPNISGKFTDI